MLADPGLGMRGLVCCLESSRVAVLRRVKPGAGRGSETHCIVGNDRGSSDLIARPSARVGGILLMRRGLFCGHGQGTRGGLSSMILTGQRNVMLKGITEQFGIPIRIIDVIVR